MTTVYDLEDFSMLQEIALASDEPNVGLKLLARQMKFYEANMPSSVLGRISKVPKQQRRHSCDDRNCMKCSPNRSNVDNGMQVVLDSFKNLLKNREKKSPWLADFDGALASVGKTN